MTSICLGPYISKMAGDRVGYSGTPIGNAMVSNGHMLDDVKVVTQIYLESNNFLTLGDRGSVSMEHQ